MLFKSYTFSFFKPLVASSLAVVLSGGVLSGQDIEVNSDQTQGTITNQGVIFNDGNQSKKLTLSATNNVITSITFKNTTLSSTNNFLVLNTGKTTITNQVNVNAEKAIIFDLNNGTELNLAGGISGDGKSRIRILSNGNTTGNGYTATLSGGSINGMAIEFMGGGTQELKIQNNTANLRSIGMNINGSGDKTLTLDTTSNSVSASVSDAVSGDLLTLNFGGKANNNSNTASFTFQNTGDSTLKGISIANPSSASDNTLTLNHGKLTIANTIDITNTKGITFHLDTATLAGSVTNKGAFNLDFTASGGIFDGTLTTGESTTTPTAITNINISNNSSGTIIGAVTTDTSGTTNINFANGSGAKTLTLQGNNNTLSSITLNSGGATTNNTLILQNGTTSIAQAINIQAQQGLLLDLQKNSNLTLAGLLTNAGSAGVNFGGTSTLTSSITTTAGNTNISLANGANSTITSDVSTSGGETTIVFNGASTLTLNSGNGIITTNGGKTTLDFKSSNGILKGKLGTQGGEVEIQLARGAQGTISGNISLSSSGSNNIKYNGVSTLILQGTNNAISTLDTSGQRVQGTLKIDASNNENTTTINKAILGDKLLVNLGGTSNHVATFSLSNASNNNSSTSSTIKTLTLKEKTKASQNVFSLTGGTTTVTDGVKIGKEQGLSINLSNGANLTSNISNASGNAEINFNTPSGGVIGGMISTTTTLGSSDKGSKINIANGANGTIKGDITTGENANTTITFNTDTTNQASTLTLQGKTNQINTITVNGDSKTLTLDGKNSNSGVNVDVKTAIAGGGLTAKFDGEANKATNLTLNAGGNALKALTLGTTSISNTLTLNNGITTITDKIAIGSSQALDFTLNNNSNLTLSGNLENSGNSNINFSGANTLTSTIDTKNSGITNINVFGDSNGTITGNVTTENGAKTNVKYAPNSDDSENSLKLMGNSNTLTSISFDQSARSGKLILGDNASGNNTTITNNISGDSVAGGKLIVEFNGSSHTSHLTLNGSSNTLKAIELSGTQNTLTLTAGDTTITDWVRVQTSQGITFDINNANLTFTNSLYNEGGQVYFTLNGNTTIGGDITTSSEPYGTIIYILNNDSSTNKGSSAVFNGKIDKETTGTNILLFDAGNNSKTITLNASQNILNSITFGDMQHPQTSTNSTNNTLALTNGNTTIESEVEIQSSQALAFDLGNGTNLTLSGNLKTSGGKTDINFSGTSTLSSSINTTSGTTTLNVANSANGDVSNTITTNSGATTNINFKSAINQNTNSLSLNGSGDNQITTLSVEDGGNAQLKGKNATIGTINLGDSGNSTSKLTLFNTQSTITALTPSTSGATTFSMDGTFNSVTTTITNAVNGNNLTLNFNGRGESNKTKLTLQQGSNTLKALTLGANSTANAISLTTGKTTITDKINVANNSDITLDLGDNTELALTSGMDTAGTSTLQVIANGSARSATLSGGNTTATHLKLTGDASHSASITLKNPSINLTALTTSGSAENTLTLDTSTQGVETIISQAINGNNLKVELKGENGKTAKLSLGNTSNGTNTTSTIKTLALGSRSANGNTAYNTLELKGGNTTITDTLSIEANKGINFDFSGTSSLQNTLTNSAGVLTLNFKQEVGTLNGSISTNGGNTSINLSDGASGIITGSINRSGGTTTISYASGASAKTLTLQGGDNKITQLNIDGTNNTFTLTNGTTTIDGKINIDNGEEFTTNLTSTANLTLTGNLDNSGNHTINFNGTSHTLSGAISTLSGGTTSLNLSTGTQATITGDTSSAGITNINLANNASLTLDKKLSTTAGNATIDFKGESGKIQGGIETTSNATTTFNFGLQDSQIAAATIDGALTNTSANQVFNINAKSTTLKVGDNGLNFSNGNNTININTEDSTLSWQNKNGENKNISTSGGTTKIDFQNSGVIETGIITSGGSTDINVQQNKIATISGNITTSGSGKTNLTFQGSNSTLILKGSANTLYQITSTSGSNNIISLSEGETHDERTSTSDRRKLTIENITKDSKPLTFISQTTATNADTFLIKGSTTKSRNVQIPSTHSLGIVVAKGVKLSDIGKSGEILVASVESDLDIAFDSTSQVVAGFTTATAVFNTKQTDENGNVQDQGDYTSYFIKGMQNTQVIAAEQEITATAFTLNYDLYMANFNSLNKRMGELRENPHSQGVWLRVFNGALSNDFGLKTKTNYTTIQTGYDYAFGNEGSNNYLGFALSYALSTSTSEHAFDVNAQKRSVDSIYSNAFEVALYNSYVNDEGFYNDTIVKFSYIMSDFKINNLNDPTQITSTTNDTKNFALTLSDEVGYKFALGESKEWGITPQLEVGFGYFNQSNFKQTLQDLGAFLQSNADAVMTVRTRVGSSFSYDFKALSQLQNFNASIYLGAFYEYDYVNGGDITFRTDQITQDTANNLSHLQSDGRVVLNIGTNMNIKENTRIYFDFEKSFMGKINTDYQVNLGVRYSFGENAGYTPVPQPIVEEKKAPLKIQEDSKPL